MKQNSIKNFVQVLLFFILATTTSSNQVSDTSNCEVRDATLSCKSAVPKNIPAGVTEVVVHDFVEEQFDISMFDDKSWKLVKILDISVANLVQFEVLNGNLFHQLDSLEKLRLKAFSLKSVSIEAFKGLVRLRQLEFQDCAMLDVQSLARALLVTSELSSLHTLVLRDKQSVYSTLTYIDKIFVDSIIERNITNLVLSGQNVIFTNVANIRSPLPVVHLDISNLIFTGDSVLSKSEIGALFINVEVLNWSGIGYFMNDKSLDIVTCPEDSVVFLTRLKMLYADHFKRAIGKWRLNADLTSCKINLKFISIASSGIESIDWQVKWPIDSPKCEVDFSSNKITTFKVSGYTPIFKLNLSDNKLSAMEDTDNFPRMFQAFQLLEYVDLSWNGLNYLPYDIFSNSTFLKQVHLVGNFLTDIGFDVRKLVHLRWVDLSNNDIQYLKQGAIDEMRVLESTESRNKSNGALVLNLQFNPLKCSCESSSFVAWITSKQREYKHDKHRKVFYDLNCYMEGKDIPVDTNTLKTCYFLCIRTTVFASVSVFLVVVFVALLFIVVKVRKRNIEKLKESLIEDFQMKAEGDQYLVMLSHSQIDGKVVFHRMVKNFDRALKNITGVDKEVICIGDIHFRPGMAIVDEVYRCVHISYVAVFVISKAFCESPWCIFELKEAFSQCKPIILIFLEEIPTDDMSPLMKEIFNRYTRVKMVRENGYLVMRPDWDAVAKSVITLSAREWDRISGFDYSPDDLLNLKREIFEKLTSIAETVLKFTNSAEEEKDQIRSILNELALRHKQDGSKKNFLARETSTTESQSTTSLYGKITARGEINSDDETKRHDDVTESKTTDVTQPTTSASSVTAPVVRDMTLKKTTKTCLMYGMNCSPQDAEICCEQLYCKRKSNYFGSTYGRCRFI